MDDIPKIGCVGHDCDACLARGWKPIESAPKDGTPIMACTWLPTLPHLYSPRRVHWATYHPNANGKECWRDSPICGNKLERLTHWMPLLPPPEPT